MDSSPLLLFVLRLVSSEGKAIADSECIRFTDAIDGERFSTAEANFPGSGVLVGSSNR